MVNRNLGGDYASMLWSVAEQLKVPLGIISRRAELAKMADEYSAQDAADILVQADIGLALVDSYLLGIDLWQNQAELPLEAVSISYVMADTAQELYRYAKQMEVSLEISIEGRYGPVMANPRGLKAAMLSLGCALVENVQSDRAKPRLILSVHRTENGIAAGMYGASGQLNPSQWRASQELQGSAPQPIQAVHGSGAGLFVADSILQAMGSRLETGRRGKQNGLKATFLPSQQLALI